MLLLAEFAAFALTAGRATIVIRSFLVALPLLVFIALCFAVSLLLLLYRAPEAFQVGREQRISPVPYPDYSGTAGELVEGTVLAQTFFVPPQEASDVPPDKSDEACLMIMLANYGGRENSGKCRVVIRSGGIETTGYIDYSRVADNKFHKICFESLRPSDVIGRTNRLELIADEGGTGSSITAWLSSDTRLGTAAVNGEETGKSLVFYMAVNRTNTRNIVIIMGLAITFSGLFTVLVRSGAGDRARDADQKGGNVA